MAVELDLSCPGYELVVERRRGSAMSPADAGLPRARQINERAHRAFKLSWKEPNRGLFKVLLQAWVDCRGTTLPFSLALPGGEQVSACFDAPPRRTHGNAGRGRVEVEAVEVR